MKIEIYNRTTPTVRNFIYIKWIHRKFKNKQTDLCNNTIDFLDIPN